MLLQYLAIGATVLAALIGAGAALRARRPVAARLELVDLDFRRVYREHGTPDLFRTKVMEADVKVRNVGREPIVIAEAEITCRRSAGYPDPSPPVAARAVEAATGTLDPSATYEMSIQDGEAPFLASTRLSQVLKEGEADRFLIRLTVPEECSGKLYEVQFVLRYNADQSVLSPPAILAFPGLPGQGADGFGDTPAELTRFLDSVSRLRAELRTDAERAGLPDPDWSDPGRALRELAEQRFVRLVNALGPTADDVIITDEFWAPRGSVERYLDELTERADTVWACLQHADRVVELNGVRPQRHLQSYRERLKAHREALPGVRREIRRALHERGM